MKMPFYNSLELAGLIIVLLATAYQLTLISEVSDMTNSASLVRVEQKVNEIWFQVSDLTPTYDETSQRSTSFNYWIPTDYDQLQNEKNWFTGIYTIIMLIGSTLLILGRYFEMRESARRRNEI